MMTQEMANGVHLMVIGLFVKFIIVWVVLSIIFVSIWAVVRMTQKHRGKTSILWAIGLGAKSVDEIVAKTGIDRGEVEELLQDLVEDKVIEEEVL